MLQGTKKEKQDAVLKELVNIETEGMKKGKIGKDELSKELQYFYEWIGQNVIYTMDVFHMMMDKYVHLDFEDAVEMQDFARQSTIEILEKTAKDIENYGI